MKLAERVDRSIVLARTTIELLLGDSPVTARAKVVLRLSPRPRVVIEFDFPRNTNDQAAAYGASNDIQTRQFLDVRIASGIKIRTSVGGEWRIGGNESWCGGMLVPAAQPATVVHNSDKVSRCKFALINFPNLWGAQDIHRPVEGRENVTTVFQRMELVADQWLVQITGVDAVGSLDHLMRRSGGSAITHVGSVARTDEGDFALDELDRVLDALHLFLSFVRGSYCGLAFLSGQDSQRRTVWKQWGSREAEPWRGPLSTWMNPGESEVLSSLFDGFFRRFVDPSWNDAVSQVLRWYLRSNESSEPAVGIALTQAALERLSHAINQQRAGPTGEQIADALGVAGVSSTIPSQCPELITIAQSNILAHGPHAFVKMRNNLVHPDNQLGPVPPAAYAEAWHLGQWYVELMLLYLFGYSGRYYNRLRATRGHGAPIQSVPWASATGGGP